MTFQEQHAALLPDLKKRGTDKTYLLWLRTQPSALDGNYSYDTGTWEQLCEPAHYRTAKNSGKGCKPEYCAIPLTHKQHHHQHQVGQYRFMSREWWEEQVLRLGIPTEFY